MRETPDIKPSNRPGLATLMMTVSGVGALLALSFAVAVFPRDRPWSFVLLAVDVLISGSIVWVCRRVGVNQLLLQISLASWMLFLLNLVSPMGKTSFPDWYELATVLELAALGVVVTSSVIFGIRKAGSPTHARYLGWWLMARAVSWNLLGAGLLLAPLEILFLILTRNPIE